MALVLADRVKETTTTAGTGTITLAGAATGFQSFAVVGDGNTTFYTIASQTGNEWEVGVGTYATSGTTLARTTVLSNSSATQPSALNFSAGTKDVFVTYPAGFAVASTNVGTSGQLLTSNGTGVAPTYQTSTAASKAYVQAISILNGL
jgi:hypothetical protein